MEKGYKLRIYPNKQQQILLAKSFGCTRYVYNHFLDRRIKLYKEEQQSLTYTQCSKELTALKQQHEWLREPDKCALQNALKDLDTAYQHFFKEKTGFPKFKSKKEKSRSYRTNYSNGNIAFYGKTIKLPKLGYVRCRGYKEIPGRILNVTISQVPSGKFYATVCATDVDIPNLPKTNRHVGIDMGLTAFITTSDGIVVSNPKYLKQSLEKLVKLQRSLSRKTKGSANWNKTRVKIAKLHEHIANQRKDHINKTSTNLVKHNDVICIETLKSQNMMQNKKLARNIGDVSWYEFARQLDYKAQWYGKKLVKIDAFYASSQLCSVCGYKNPDIKNLIIRAWDCPQCGSHHDRDISAAKKHLKRRAITSPINKLTTVRTVGTTGIAW